MITLKDNFKGLVKPSGKLVLNRKNQFARNLSTAIFDIPSMQDQQGAAYAVTHPEVIPNVDEHGAYFSKIADSGDSFVSWPNNTPKITGNDPRTVIIIHKTVTASQNGRILTYGTNATGQRDTFRYDTGGDLRIEVSGGSFTTSINPTLDIHVSGFKFQGTQLAGYSVFSDGVIENATGTTTINTGTDAWAMLGDPFSGGSGRGVTDQIYGRFTWNRALSDAEIVEFCKNPWQLLRRVPTRVAFPVEGGGGTLEAETGTYTYTGTDASLETARILNADSGAYIYTGTDATLTAGVQLIAESGSYVYSGTDAALIADRVIDADSGAYVYTGTDAALVFTPAGAFDIDADTGAYTYTGTDAALTQSRILNADSGTYVYTGTDANLASGFLLVADSGSYAYTGTNVDLVQARVLSADAGAYNYTGTDAALVFTPIGALSTSCNLVDRNNNPLPNLTLLSWSWFDHVDPIDYIAPTDQGDAETTDGTGLIVVDLPNSTLASGQSGSLILRSNDGTLLGAYNLEVSI